MPFTPERVVEAALERQAIRQQRREAQRRFEESREAHRLQFGSPGDYWRPTKMDKVYVPCLAHQIICKELYKHL